MAEHMRVRPADPHTSGVGQSPQATGRGVTVHPGTPTIEQDRPTGTGADRGVDGPADCGWQRDQHDFGAFAAHAQHPVTMLFAQVGDVRASGLEDPQAEQPEHGHEGEVAGVRRLAGRGEQGLELQVGEPEGR